MGSEIGTGHYGKTLQQYLDGVAQTHSEMNQAWHMAHVDLALKLRSDLQLCLGANQTLRTASHELKNAG